ncbi:hypothetical protein GCM10010970_05890 [Silvimonas iriomotensis]|uniref:Flagellar hook-associated protein 2 n=1 Tax=Silvimonas iriomotensis TaxID=449662 RepID=A0ABQ2P5I7_9NEIS|nr:hypothetical protein GCM10010970_05890 [Silvimonas iriomotensis]
MGAITSMGVGSGIDVSGIISQLMQVEQQPLLALQKQEASYDAQLSALGTLQGALTDFQSTLTALSDPTKLQLSTATLANTSVGTATATNSAQQGTHSLIVSQLAQNQVIASADVSSPNNPVGTGSLTISFGSYSDSGGFSANATQQSITVNIDSTNNNLFGLRDAINAAKGGVTASVINDGNGFRLALSSNTSGAVNGMKITATGANGDTGLNAFTYDPASTTNSMSVTQKAQDAQFSLDGINISKPTNTINDVLSGVTLNLTGTNTDATTLTIGTDTTSLVKNVQAMVDGYNSFMSQLSSLTGYDTTTQTAGILNGQYSLNSIKTQLRSVFNKALGGSNAYQSLFDVGVGFDDKGNMTLDQDKLTSSAQSNPQAIATLFASGTSVSKPGSVTVVSTSSTLTKAGTYAINVTSPAKQGTVTSGSGLTFPLTIGADNDFFTAAIDGVQSGTVKLTDGTTYNNGNDLAAAIQTALNNDSAIKAAGVSANVSFANGALQFSSASYGSTSSIQVTTAATGGTSDPAFLSVTNKNTGTDAVATIGGVPATATGNVLVGTGDAAGMIISLAPGSTGDMGSVTYSQGFSYNLNQAISNMVSTKASDNGLFKGVTDSINASITRLQSQESEMQTRLAQVQANYVQQFTAMDTTVGTLKNTSSYLTTQLANLPKISS